MFESILLVAHGRNPHSLIFTDESDGEQGKKSEETFEDFLKFYLPS